jgi:hypothetical protein
MTRQAAEVLAQRITDYFFTNGCAERAERLVLTGPKPVERNLGGWSEAAMRVKLEEFLTGGVRADTPTRHDS